MTKESICARCAELIRVRVRRDYKNVYDKRICPLGGIQEVVLDGDVVEGCSRFVEEPGDQPKAEEKK